MLYEYESDTAYGLDDVVSKLDDIEETIKSLSAVIVDCRSHQTTVARV